MQIAIEILIVLVLVTLNGVLAGSEMAVVSARRVRLQQRAEAGDAGAKAALALASEPNRFLSTVQIGITLIGILAGAFGGATLAQALASSLQDSGVSDSFSEPAAVAIVVLGITYLSLIVGELVPKRVALQHPDRIASIISRPMRTLSGVMSPAVWFLGRSTDFMLAVLRVRPQAQSPVSEEEIRMIIKESTEAGVFEPAEHEMIRSTLQLGDRNVTGLMAPRRDVVWIAAAETPESIRDKIAESFHSRFPVCDANLDAVIGIVSVRDIWLQTLAGGALEVSSVLRQPLFLPESLNVLQALERFREERTTLGIVVDEYGGTAGVVSLTDILEEIVGDLPSTEDVEPPSVVQRADGSWLIDGGLPTEKVLELFELKDLPHDDEYRTLAGFILLRLGRIPVTGDYVEWSGYRFEVVDMDEQRIDKVLVTRRGR